MVVRQKGKKAPITVESDVKSPEGPIHLRVRASLDDWKKLNSVSPQVRSGIFESILGEAKGKIRDSDRYLPRSLSKDELNFTQKVRRSAIYTHEIIKANSETDFYKKLVEMWGDIKYPGIDIKKRKKPKFHDLTVFVLDRIFSKEKRMYLIGRRWAKNPENFRRTYLDLSKIKKDVSTYFHAFYIGGLTVTDAFKRYIKKSENPLEVFELFFREQSCLMEILQKPSNLIYRPFPSEETPEDDENGPNTSI